jgi:ribosomal protein S18 acetylase RimI-like enzyme
LRQFLAAMAAHNCDFGTVIALLFSGSPQPSRMERAVPGPCVGTLPGALWVRLRHVGFSRQPAGVCFLMAEPRRLDLSDPDTLRRVWELQRAAYAVEAELIGFAGIPPLCGSLQQLHDCGESFLGLDDETGLAGAVSWTRLRDGTLDICRLMVHPRAHRRGIATTLLDSLDQLEPATRAVVATGSANLPALALYRRRGFTPTGTRQVGPATTVTLLERRTTPSGAPGS